MKTREGLTIAPLVVHVLIKKADEPLEPQPNIWRGVGFALLFFGFGLVVMTYAVYGFWN